MTVLSIDAPRVSRRCCLPAHQATATRLQQVIARLEREVQAEAAELPEPRRKYVYITFEEVSEWPDPPPQSAA